ncbi:MAG TPA: CDP-alcohol phosphatidyltransferase family protein [Phycisphaerae bacterium]|jgi:phosphatidylglycerophosphate synthase
MANDGKHMTAPPELPDDHEPGVSKEFARFRSARVAAGSSLSIGQWFMRSRDRIAARLIAKGVTPNHVTVAGFVVSSAAAICYFLGAGHHAPYEADVPGLTRSYWPLCGALLLILAGACDMVDGAVARLGRLHSEFGGLLDSTLDRASEMIIYLGITAHFARSGNLTYCVLAMLALANANLISYVKARAEEYVDDCSVGYWLRGERHAALLLAGLSAHLPIMLWQQALSPFFTVIRRVVFARQAIRARQRGQPAPPIVPTHGWQKLLLWRYPRGSVPYDIVTGSNIAFFTVLPWIHPVFYGAADPLRRWLGG